MPIVLFFSSRQISAHPIRNFRSNQSTPGRFDNTEDVKDVLMHLNIYKACGPDLLSPRLLKEGTTALAEPLSILFKRSLEKCYFPVTWKDAIHDKSLPFNYRPISLLSSIGKKVNKKVQEQPQTETAANPRHQEEEKVTQINVCIANKQMHDTHKDQLPLPQAR